MPRLMTPSSVLVLLLCAACQDPTALFLPPEDEPPAVDVEHRTLHVMLPLTGPIDEIGEAWAHAAELAIAEVDAAGALRDDRTVTLRWHDTAFDPEEAGRIADDIADAQAPQAIVGPISSSELTAVNDRAGEALAAGRLAVLSPTASSPVFDGAQGVFRMVNDVSAYAERLAEFTAGIDGVVRSCKQAVVISQLDSFNQLTADAFKARFTDLEGQLLVDNTFNPDNTDTTLQGIGTGAAAAIEMQPGVIEDGVCLAVFGFPQQASVVIDRVRDAAPDGALVSVIVGEVSLADLVEGTAEVPVLTLSPTHERDARLTALEALWDEDAHGPVPDYAPMVFDATLLGALALGTSADDRVADAVVALSSGGEAFDVTELPATAEALRAGADLDYQGVSGPADLNTASGAAAGPLSVMREIGDGWEEVAVLDAR